jgi:predicted CXXCH cytochrome family protein
VRGHAIIENECANCHTGLFRGVANKSCVGCHVDVRRHAPANLAMEDLETLRCTDCHSEHRGREISLAEQGSALCVGCHAQLADRMPNLEIKNVSDFEASHPEIRLMVVMEPAAPPVRMAWSESLGEDSGIEFDHFMHVGQGVEGPEDVERLACGQCHQVEENGRHMRPVSFDRDCRHCHELDAGEPELADRLVHGDPERMREELRAFYTERVLAGEVEDRGAPRRLRMRRAGPLVETEERALAASWIEEQVERAEERVFDDEGCTHCHRGEGGFLSEETGDWIPRDVGPVHLARNWIENARFDHSAHATQPCARCHPGAAMRDPDADVEDEPEWARAGAIPFGLVDEESGVKASQTSADVMIPGLETCRGCHVSPEDAGAGMVASPCSACHAFHDHALEPMAALRWAANG